MKEVKRAAAPQPRAADPCLRANQYKKTSDRQVQDFFWHNCLKLKNSHMFMQNVFELLFCGPQYQSYFLRNMT